MSKTKSIISILMGVLLMFALVGCGGSKDAEGIYTPGTYTATAAGYGGDVEVEVEVDADKIVAVKVLENSETEGISDGAIENIPAAIVEKQSTDVDTVAGATSTSGAIKEAAQKAIDEAKIK